MANEEHLKILKQGVKAWNEWRKKNPKITPDLTKADLRGANLRKANLNKANLQSANLQKADLQEAELQKALLSAPFLGGEDMNLDKAAHLQKANLVHADLREAMLRGVNLRGANLSDANLEKADLCFAQVHGATLHRANLNEAGLSKIEGLHEVKDGKLSDIKLEGATGLTGDEFRMTDITGAILPEGIRDFRNLDVAKETAQNARKIFFSMLLGCVYSGLTIATTNDVRLLTNSASLPLPIIGAQIPIVWFYIAAPLLLLGIYVYMHLYLQRLWDRLATLPAVFQDGRPLHERAYPWLLIGLVSAYFEILRDEEHRPPLSGLQVAMSLTLAWGVVPFTFIFFWGRYLTRHDWWGTAFHIILIAAATALAFDFYRLCRNTLGGKDLIKRRAFVLLAAVGIIMLFLSYTAIEIPIIKADLHQADLRAAYLQGADLTGANLQGAKLQGAKLQGAKLQGANLEGAMLKGTDLQDAVLTDAQLQDAVGLTRIQIEKAKINKGTELPDYLQNDHD